MKKILFTLCLCTIQLGFAQLSPKVTDRFPAHILTSLNDLNTRIPITEDKQIQIGQRLLANDSIANIQKNTLPPEKLKQLYTLNKALLSGVLEESQLETFLYQEDKDNRLLLALVKTQQLQLTAPQIVAIRKQVALLEDPNTKKPSKPIPFYRQKLDSILDKKQQSMLTYFVFKEDSKIETDSEWLEINQLQLLRNQDPKKAYTELLNYNTARNIYLDEPAEKFSPRVLADAKSKFILERQPLFLIHKKILLNNQYQNSLFAIALLNEKRLELTPVQVDSLLLKCKELELLKNSKKGSQAVGVFPFVNTNITKILNSKQLLMALTFKNQNDANQFAYESWKKIEKQNWTTGLDKNATIKEFANYKLKSLVINDRLKIDNNQANLFARRDVETKKPELLKKLDELKATENNTKSTKNALKW